MSDNTRRLLAWLPMAGVAALALHAIAVWDQLPAVMMSHFDAQGNANGYMPREPFFAVSFAILVFTVTLMAVMTDRIGRRKAAAGWGLLALTWVTNAFLIATFWAAITANLEHAPLRIVPVWILLVVLIPVTLAISIDGRWWLSGGRREAARQMVHPAQAKIGIERGTISAQLITEQRHGSRGFALLFVLTAAGMAALVFALPSHGRPAFVLPLVGGIVALILASALWAWRGFVYRFTTQGIEVRALGFRLRSIPVSQITEFRAQRVNPLTDFGGWGIKGFGSDTAYIWGGHKALHIRTNRGDVYLGHNDPDRLVRDLEAIIAPAHKG